LTDAEEEALVAYTIFLYRGRFPAFLPMIQAAASLLRSQRSPPARPVSSRWVKRWLKDQPILTKSKFRPVDSLRRAFELNESAIKDWFAYYRQVVTTLRVEPSDIWNFDEAGIQIGQLQAGHTTVVILRELLHQRPEIDNFSNREMCTIIAGGSAIGQSIPAYVIFKTDVVEEFLITDFDRDFRFAKSSTGFSNAELTLDYLRHFNRYSFKRSATFVNLGVTLREWFGYDEDIPLDDNFLSTLSLRSGLRAEAEVPRFRLLLIDNFSGHCDIRVSQYAQAFDIRILPLIPHSSHITQPLDVGVFQPMKAQHRRLLNEMVAIGHTSFRRLDFVKILTPIYNRGIQPHHILTGFEETGLWPIDEEQILLKITVKQHTAIQPRFPCLMPAEDRHESAKSAISWVITRYGPEMSSPTRQSLNLVDSSINEAILLKAKLDQQREFELQMKQRKNNKMRRRIIRPTAHLLSIDGHSMELISQASRDQEREVQRRKAYNHWKKECRLRDQDQKKYWQDNLKGQITWKKYQEQLRHDNDDYIPFEDDKPEPTWFIDLQGQSIDEEDVEIILDGRPTRLPTGISARFVRGCISDNDIENNNDEDNNEYNNENDDEDDDEDDDEEDDEESDQYDDQDNDQEGKEELILPSYDQRTMINEEARDSDNDDIRSVIYIS
jgi:hypothetical protein